MALDRAKRIERLEREINTLRTEMGLPVIDYSATSNPLAVYYRSVKKSDQIEPGELDAASDAAIEAISQAGFDGDDSDRLGATMSDDVQTLLTLAFVRCPELVEGLLIYN